MKIKTILHVIDNTFYIYTTFKMKHNLLRASCIVHFNLFHCQRKYTFTCAGISYFSTFLKVYFLLHNFNFSIIIFISVNNIHFLSWIDDFYSSMWDYEWITYSSSSSHASSSEEAVNHSGCHGNISTISSSPESSSELHNPD